jgi:glycosyltransferase involved in cell wall biosynthesis
MISGRDFVVLSDNFHGLPTSAIHLFRRLGRRNRVFWFNTIGRLPRLSRADVGKVFRTLGGWLRRCRPAEGQPVSDGAAGVHVVNPIMVPWFKPWIRRFNCRRLVGRYQQLCADHDITDPILVTTFPYAVDFLKAVPEGMKIYYCVDDFLDYPGVNHRDWAVMEAELLQIADALIVTSRDLVRKRVNSRPLLHLPHGVDFDHFYDAVARPETIPALESLPRPIVGFFGLISEWVDLDLIRHLSESFPRTSFVLIGRSDVDLKNLADRPNIHALGFVPYAELPKYARYFDVGLIPFVLNQLTRAVNPLKLMEYFALGLPVLSTRLPELENIEGPLRLAVTQDDFSMGLRDILENRNAFPPEEAFAAARANTWDERVEQLSEFLEAIGGCKPRFASEIDICQPWST